MQSHVPKSPPGRSSEISNQKTRLIPLDPVSASAWAIGSESESAEPLQSYFLSNPRPASVTAWPPVSGLEQRMSRRIITLGKPGQETDAIVARQRLLRIGSFCKSGG